MIVVGLSGFKESGKDAVADILVRDYGFTKMAFAAPLKRMVKALNPIVGSHAGAYFCDCEGCASEVEHVYLADLYDDYDFTDEEIKKSEYGHEIRRLWERFGTEVFREEDPDYWVIRAARELAETTADRIVFTDVRFENEADFIFSLREEGLDSSSVWRVARPGYHGGTHAAEQGAGLLEEEVTILNDGTLHDLEEPVALAMDMLLNKVYPGQLALEIEGL